MTPEMIPGIVILAVMIGGGIWQRGREKREWNNGICASSGEPWQHFDCDSQGGRGYKDGFGNLLWISHRVDSIANNQNTTSRDHFVDVNKMVAIGSGAAQNHES